LFRSSKEEDQVTYNQMLASDYFNKLVEVLPKINSRYAAFKAAEIAVMHSDFDQFLHNVCYQLALSIVSR